MSERSARAALNRAASRDAEGRNRAGTCGRLGRTAPRRRKHTPAARARALMLWQLRTRRATPPRRAPPLGAAGRPAPSRGARAPAAPCSPAVRCANPAGTLARRPLPGGSGRADPAPRGSRRPRAPWPAPPPVAPPPAAPSTYGSRTGWNFPCLPSAPGRQASVCACAALRCAAVSSLRTPLARDSLVQGTFPGKRRVAAGPGAGALPAARGASGASRSGSAGLPLAPRPQPAATGGPTSDGGRWPWAACCARLQVQPRPGAAP